MNITATSNASETIEFKGNAPVLAAFTLLNGQDTINTNTGQDSVPEALEYALYFCIQAYNASVSRGVLTQTVVNSWSQMG